MKVLYITYLGILEPIPKSQVLPYLFELSNKTHIYLLSFEKKKFIKKNKEDLETLQKELNKKGIIWYRLPYHKYPLVLSSFFDIFVGFIFSFFLILRHKITIVHARANIPIAIGFLLKYFSSVQLLYDRRGMMGDEHVEHSGWKKNGIIHRLSKFFEKKVFKKSNAVVVLTYRMKEELPFIESSRIYTIPCCTDLEKFKRITEDERNALIKKLGLHKKFVLIYSGSLGTYNVLKEMFDFFTIALDLIPNAHLLILSQNQNTVSNFIKEHSINTKTITTLSTSYPHIASYLSLGHAGLIFRQHSPTAIAACPTKLGEYLACELPIISLSAIGDLKRIVNSHQVGVTFDTYEVSQYKYAIQSFIYLFQEEENLRKRCRRAAEELFHLKKGANVYFNIYQSL